MSNRESFEYVVQKAADGDYRYMVLAAVQCHLGLGTPKNETLSAEWLERAATCDDPEFLTYMGELFEHGTKVQQNLEKAEQLYQRAAEIKEFIGTYMLARLFSNRSYPPTFQNNALALRYVSRAAAAGHIPSKLLRLTLLRKVSRFGKLIAFLATPWTVAIAMMSLFSEDLRARFWRYTDVMRPVRILEKKMGPDRAYHADRPHSELGLH